MMKEYIKPNIRISVFTRETVITASPATIEPSGSNYIGPHVSSSVNYKGSVSYESIKDAGGVIEFK